MTIDKLDLWKGKFGDEYRERNQLTEENINNRYNLWVQVIRYIYNNSSTPSKIPSEYFEIGAGLGGNLIAINRLMELNNINSVIMAQEPNIETRKLSNKNCRQHDFQPAWVDEMNLLDSSVDVVFTSGVLIHIPPDLVLNTMRDMYRISKKYIVCIEYFSPKTREHIYHGEQAMWSTDFGSVWLDNFNLRCLGCFFMWKRLSGLDNLTVWIFEKVN